MKDWIISKLSKYWNIWEDGVTEPRTGPVVPSRRAGHEGSRRQRRRHPGDGGVAAAAAAAAESVWAERIDGERRARAVG